MYSDRPYLQPVSECSVLQDTIHSFTKKIARKPCHPTRVPLCCGEVVRYIRSLAPKSY